MVDRQPFTLNVYKMTPDMTDEEQYDDCTQYDRNEIICDLGLKI